MMFETGMEIARGLRGDGMKCACDLDKWEPERSTGHTLECPIHNKALSLFAQQVKPPALAPASPPVGEREAPSEMMCGGVVGADTTRAELLERGFQPAAADEILAYRDRLASQAPVQEIMACRCPSCGDAHEKQAEDPITTDA